MCKKFLLGFMLASTAVLAGAGSSSAQQSVCEPAKLSKKYPSLVGKTIKIGQDGESAPFSMRDPGNRDHLIGVDADLARATFECIGVKIEFVVGTWSGLLAAATSGQLEIMWDSLLYSPVRAKRMDFVPYLSHAAAIIVAKGNPLKIKSGDDLCGVRSTGLMGSSQIKFLEAANVKCGEDSKKPIEIIASADVPSGLRLLATDRADALSTNAFVADQMVASEPRAEVGFRVPTGSTLAVGIEKGNVELRNAVFEGLTILYDNGTVAKIMTKYGIDPALALRPSVLTD